MDSAMEDIPSKSEGRMAAQKAMWRLQRHASEGLLFLKRRRRIRLRRFRVRFRCAPEVLEFLPQEEEWSDVDEGNGKDKKPKCLSKLKGRRGSGVRYRTCTWDPDEIILDEEEMHPPMLLCVLCLLAIALAAAYQWIPRPAFFT